MRRTRTSHKCHGNPWACLPASAGHNSTLCTCMVQFRDRPGQVSSPLSLSLWGPTSALPLAVLPVDSSRCLTSSLLSNVMWALSYRPSTRYGTRFFPFNFVIEPHWCSSIRGITQIWSHIREESRKVQAWWPPGTYHCINMEIFPKFGDFITFLFLKKNPLYGWVADWPLVAV